MQRISIHSRHTHIPTRVLLVRVGDTVARSTSEQRPVLVVHVRMMQASVQDTVLQRYLVLAIRPRVALVTEVSRPVSGAPAVEERSC